MTGSSIVSDRPDIVGPWVCSLSGGTWIKGRGTALGLVRDNQIIAGVLYEDWNGANVNVHIAANGVNWLNREFLRVMFDYPFRQLGCNRLTSVTYSGNHASLRFQKHLGFEHEAVLREAHPTGDLIVMAMHRDKCKWFGGVK